MSGVTPPNVESPAAPRAPSPGDNREAQREFQREMAKLGREQAQMAKEVARTAAESAHASIEAKAESSINGVRVVIPPLPPMPPLPNFGGKSIVGTLNGGGVDIKLTSMNGTITLREVK